MGEELSKDIYVHPTAEVSELARVGKGTKIWHQAQVREEAIIGENCVLGKNVYVDKKVKIGNGVKIENNVSVYQGVTIEDEVIMGAGTTFTNDLYPRAFNPEWKIVPTLVKKGASLGTNTAILCGLTVGSYALVGAGSVVTHNVPDYGLVFGNPAKLKGFVCPCGRKLEEKQKVDKLVQMNCPVDGQIIKISSGTYEMVER